MTKSRCGLNITDVAFVAFLVTGLVLLPSRAMSQEEEAPEEEAVEIEELIEEYEETIEKYDEKEKDSEKDAIKGAVKMSVRPPLPPMPSMFAQQREARREARPRLGLYLDDMDFEHAYEAHYPENYGVLIDGVVRGGSADLAGLREGDIIMEFDGEKVRYEDHLLRIRNTRSIGDTVEIKFFRDEKVMTTNIIFYPPSKEEVDEFGEVPDEVGKKLSPGYGGGGFEPYFIDFDFKGINDFLTVNGFAPIPKGLVVAWGGGGMGNVGNGWFIGGAGAGIEKREQISVQGDQGNVTRAYRLESGFGGVTLQKKVPLFTDRFVLDTGVLLGGGATKLWVSQTEGDFSWSDTLGTKGNYSVQFEKGYFVYRPSIGLLVRIKNWVGIHGSVGYLGTYASDDTWTEKPFDFTPEGPAVPSGLSFTLGFWFGY